MANTITAADVASVTTTGQGGQSLITGTPIPGSVVTFATFETGFGFDLSGAWSGTIVVEESVDGIAWTPISVEINGVGSVTASITANGYFRGQCQRGATVRVRCTVYTSGTVNVSFYAGSGYSYAGAVYATAIVPMKGDVAAGVTDSGNPVKVGGYGSNAAPTAVSNGQRVNAWFSQKGQQVCSVLQAGAQTDAVNITPGLWQDFFDSARGAIVCGYLFNGTTTYDRPRNNMDQTALASAARTATTSSADITNYNGRGVMVFLNVTAASGTGGLTLTIQAKDPVSGNYFNLNANPSAVTSTGNGTVYIVYPSTLTAAGNVTQSTQAVLPRTFRITVTHGDASSYTYSVGASIIL